MWHGVASGKICIKHKKPDKQLYVYHEADTINSPADHTGTIQFGFILLRTNSSYSCSRNDKKHNYTYMMKQPTEYYRCCLGLWSVWFISSTFNFILNPHSEKYKFIRVTCLILTSQLVQVFDDYGSAVVRVNW